MRDRAALADTRWTTFSAVGATLIASSALLGWAADVPMLRGVFSATIPMNPATAISFLLASTSLMLSRSHRTGRLARVIALAVVGIALLRLAGYMMGGEVGIDQILFREKLATVPHGPNRMAPNTALAFLLLGAGLFLVDHTTPRGHRPAEYGALLVAVIALLTFTGYGYSHEALARVGHHIPMALNTAVGFALLCIGLLYARPTQGLMRVMTTERSAGVTARRLIVAAVAVPWALGWMRLWGQRAALYEMEFGVALHAVATMVFLAAIVWWHAHSLDRSEVAHELSEAARREAEERLALALRSSGVGTWSWNVDEDTIAWDDYMYPLFGLGPGTVAGRYADVIDHIHPDDRARVTDEVRKALAAGDAYETEFRVVWPNGTVRAVASRGRVQRDRGTRLMGVCWDVTARKEAEDRLRDRTLQLEAANDALGSFTYSVSHDLRAPLRAIDGYARILVEDHAEKLDGDGRRVLGVICDNARKMGRLIDDLLTFSRLGRQELERTPVDMSALAQAIVDDLRRAEPDRDVTVTIGALAPALGDGNMIRQVLTNLIGNAWKFTGRRADASIEIGCSNDTAPVYFVKDNGAGFDMAYAAKLFGVFQRLHRVDEFDGTGVGLAIVQRVVQRHGGRVWADGAVDGGATFSFTLTGEGGMQRELGNRGDSIGGGHPGRRRAGDAGAPQEEPGEQAAPRA